MKLDDFSVRSGAGRGPGRPRRDEIEQRNRDLLEAALDHFVEKGFEAGSVRAIAASLGMARRTVYAQYPDKMALFKAALEHAIDCWIVPVAELEAVESGDLEETLLGVARLLVANVMSPAGQRLMRITNTESYRMPEIGVYTFSRGSQPTVDFLADLFRRRMGLAQASPRELADLAIAFLNLVVGPARMTAWGFTPDADEVERLTRQRVRIFLNGARAIG
jgi:TetR/AcrR family transcriptional regulator, mexJK operon transcriptional repressor